jgi:hypothetical protein
MNKLGITYYNSRSTGKILPIKIGLKALYIKLEKGKKQYEKFIAEVKNSLSSEKH